MNNPKYLYIYDKIPNGLDSLTQEETKIISFISSKTLLLIEDKQSSQYVQLGRDIGKSLVGDNYAKVINDLILKNILDIETIGTDLDGNPIYYSKEGKKAKSYRLKKDIIKNLKNGEYSKNKVKMPWVYIPKNKKLADVPNSEIEQKLKKNYASIKMSEDWQGLDDLDMAAYFSAKIYYKQINAKCATITTGTTGRMFHPSICMKREFRKFLTNNGKPLAIIDAKTFHPYLLAHYLTGHRREEYLSFLKSQDFYSLFVDEENNRNDIKVLFEVSLKGEKLFGKALEIYQWYEDFFPEIAEQFKDSVTMQAKLQTLESNIFIKGIFANADFWCVPMHDGLMVEEEDLQDAMIFCYNQILSILKYEVILETKPLAD